MRRALLLVLLLASAAVAKGDLGGLEKEFKKAIQKATAATVICVPWGVEKGARSSSGVVVTRSGLVLSDGDAGAWLKKVGDKVEARYEDEVEVRVADLEEGGFAKYRATVIRRMRDVDSCLLEIQDPPPGGFPEHIAPFTSRYVQVGDFSLVVGNAFGLSGEAPPTLTAGLVASLAPLPADDGGGAHEFLYTTAAVNPGVNGGPVVDMEGRLVGTVSSWLNPLPGEPYQFLGKVMPIDRLRAAYADLREAGELFKPVGENKRRAKRTLQMERVFRHVARKAHPAVVSLEVDRKTPVNPREIAGFRGKNPVASNLSRWRGPVSGVLVDDTGWIITSLYNLANLSELRIPHAAIVMPPAVRLSAGLGAIKGITVHYPGGGSAPAKLVAHDGRLGIALLKAEPKAYEGRALETASPDMFQAGRFVLALGNPFGKKQNADPLLAFGVLSKEHAGGLDQPWRGQWQTDAGVTDANAGGACVDMRGRLLGILHLWQPHRHGRSSGIGFVVPWPRIAEALPRLKKGESLERGKIGVSLEDASGGVRITKLAEGSAGAEAGLKVGDVIVSVNGAPTPQVRALTGRLAYRWAGEAVKIGIRRDGEIESVEVVLAAP